MLAQCETRSETIDHTRSPENWLDELHSIHFQDHRLDACIDLFREFYTSQLEQPDQTMIQLFEDIRQKTREYYPQESTEILKGIVLSTVFHQYNEKTSKSGRDQRYRKSELDSSGNPLPYIYHPLRMLQEAYTFEGGVVDSITAIAIAGHDTMEDCSISIPQDDGSTYNVSDATIYDVFVSEFTQGQDIADCIEAVTKYDVVPNELLQKIFPSGIYECLYRQVKGDQIRVIEGIIKGTSSLYKLRAVPMARLLKSERSNDDYRKYITAVIRNITLKCLDTNHNVPTETNETTLIRARMLATMARIIGLHDISTNIMRSLAERQDDPISQEDTSQLASELTDDRLQELNTGMEQILKDHLGVETIVDAGMRISFSDETDDGHSIPIRNAPQVIIRIPPDTYPLTIQAFNSLQDSHELATLAGVQNRLKLFEFEGVLHKITQVFGRKDRMYYACDSETGEIALYLRPMEDKPFLYEYVLQGHDFEDPAQRAPEEKFFLPRAAPDLQIEAFLNTQLLIYNATYLREYNQRNKLNVIVWKDGFTTFKDIREIETIRQQFGLENEELVEFMTEQPIDSQSQPELPIYLLK